MDRKWTIHRVYAAKTPAYTGGLAQAGLFRLSWLNLVYSTSKTTRQSRKTKTEHKYECSELQTLKFKLDLKTLIKIKLRLLVETAMNVGWTEFQARKRTRMPASADNQWAERRLVTQWRHGCRAMRPSVCNAGDSNAGRSLCVQISRERSYPLTIYWYHSKGNWLRYNCAADSFYIMKLCSRLFVLYCRNCPKDDKFR